jgi:hypothetical protein
MKKMLMTVLSSAAMVASFAGEVVVEQGGTTPHQALAQIRAAKAAGDKSAWTVRVKPGIYVLKQTLEFTPADSGTPQAPVVWIGEGETTVFAGGEPLKDWRDEGGGVWSAPVPKTPSGEPAYFEQLWVNGRRADRARIPNRVPQNLTEEYFHVVKPTCTKADGAAHAVELVAITNAGAEALWQIPDDELASAQMCIVHKWSFARRVLKKLDRTARTVETHSKELWRTGKKHSWKEWNPRETLVWFENVRSGFDAPGEWFYDKKAGRVLYRPLPGEKIESVQALAPSSKLSRLVEFKGNPDKGAYVHDISFRRLTFAVTDGAGEDGPVNGPTQAYQHQAAVGYDGAVTAFGAQRLAFDGCAFRHTGNYAMRFNDGCTSNTVVRCLLEDLGCGGVWMGSGVGYVAKGETLMRRVIKTPAPRTTAFNRIENCVIRNGGLFNPEGTGVAYTHVADSKVLHCEIYDFFYTGVSVGWTWGFRGSTAQRNEIAFNKIYDLGKGIMSDMGGVYTLGTSYGTTVHDNVIHDVWAYSYGGWALYTDEGSEGIVMERNLCWNTTDGGFHQHYGAGCVIRNNIFAWNRKLGAVRMARQVVQDIPCTLNFVNNIVVVKEGPLVGRGPRGVGGIWAGNLWYDYSGKPELDGLDWDAWKDCGKEVLGRYADPLFENAEANDFRLKPGSPAFAQGFKAWDYSTAGLQR